MKYLNHNVLKHFLKVFSTLNKYKMSARFTKMYAISKLNADYIDEEFLS